MKMADEFASGLLKKKNDRIKELEEKIERLEMMYENTGSIMNRRHQIDKIERYEKALRYISTTKDYCAVDWIDIIEDYENKAKEALEDRRD